MQRDEAERRTSEDTQEARLDAHRTEMVANLSGKEAVIGRDGFTTTKGKSRFYSRSFNYSIVRNEQFGAAIRSINSEDVGPIGDEMTFEEVDNLLTDERTATTATSRRVRRRRRVRRGGGNQASDDDFIEGKPKAKAPRQQQQQQTALPLSRYNDMWAVSSRGDRINSMVKLREQLGLAPLRRRTLTLAPARAASTGQLAASPPPQPQPQRIYLHQVLQRGAWVEYDSWVIDGKEYRSHVVDDPVFWNVSHFAFPADGSAVCNTKTGYFSTGSRSTYPDIRGKSKLRLLGLLLGMLLGMLAKTSGQAGSKRS